MSGTRTRTRQCHWHLCQNHVIDPLSHIDLAKPETAYCKFHIGQVIKELEVKNASRNRPDGT
jgi:hypothetical protein